MCSAHGPQLVSKKFLEEEIFAGTNFRELAFDRENRENFCLAKISRYTVPWASSYSLLFYLRRKIGCMNSVYDNLLPVVTFPCIWSGRLKLEMNIPLQQIFAKSKGGL